MEDEGYKYNRDARPGSQEFNKEIQWGNCQMKCVLWVAARQNRQS